MTMNLSFLIVIAKAAIVPLIALLLVPIMVWIERKGSAFIQDRPGPNRAHVGPFRLKGFLHMIADGIKFVSKESFTPKHAYLPLYFIAPFFAVAPILSTLGIIPFAEPVEIGDRIYQFQSVPLKTGLLFFFAIGSLSVYSIVLGGWSSNSRYSLLGGLRSTAQLISYEVTLILTVIGVLMIYQTVNLNEIIQRQSAWIWKWGIITQPVGFILFFVSGLAETERIPFDIPEAESEIVAGYHTEYSGLKFSMYMLGQYVTVLALSAIIAALFFGGWQIPLVPSDTLRKLFGTWPTVGLQMFSYLLKILIIYWIFVLIRWTIPRFRYDQLMHLGWKVILPLSLANIFVTGLVLLLMQ